MDVASNSQSATDHSFEGGSSGQLITEILTINQGFYLSHQRMGFLILLSKPILMVPVIICCTCKETCSKPNSVGYCNEK